MCSRHVLRKMAIVLLVITGFTAGFTVSSGAQFYVHPLLDNTVLFPSQKVSDSRHAAVIAMDAYLRKLKEPISLGTPLPMKMEEDSQPFAMKGDDLWEVTFYSEPSRKVALVFVINARTGAYQKANYTKGK